MTSHHSDEYKVGLFASAGLLLFVVTVILLGGDRAFFAKQYRLLLVLNSVEGLNTGSVVQLSGLKVGNIEKIDFETEKNHLVATLRIDQKYQDKITEGATAGVRTQGALGDKFIYISPGPSNSAPLPDGATLGSEPETDLISTLTRRGGEFQKVFDILNETHKFASGLNENGGARTLMKNLTEASVEMKQMASAMNQLAQDIRKDKDGENKIQTTLKHMASVMKKIDNGQGTLGGLVNDATLLERLKDMVGGTEQKKNMRSLIRGTIEKGEK